MLDTPLRVGIGGSGKTARGIEFQVRHADGMEFVWRHEPDDVEAHLKSEPIDVFVEACGHVHDAAECCLLAIENHAHLVLTDPRVDVAYGFAIQNEAHQNGIVVTSDIGTPHGALSTMIQESSIMGFETVQAGQILTEVPSSRFLYEMAALANGFGFLPPAGGMTGPELTDSEQILSAFTLEQFGGTPQIDFVRIPSGQPGIYLIVRPRHELSHEQRDHLQSAHLGSGPFYLLRRDAPLGYFETPKTILAAAAGQAILSPDTPTCDIYASARIDLEKGAAIQESDLTGILAPLDPSRISLTQALESAQAKVSLEAGEVLTFENTVISEIA